MPRVNIKDLGIGTGTLSYKEPRKTGWVKCLDPYPYVPYLGIGFTGTFGRTKQTRNTLEGNLCDLWANLLRRCYVVTDTFYPYYGGKDVSVCKRWHDVRVFVADVQKLKGWEASQRLDNLIELDKDYYGSNQYNPEACSWLSKADNQAYIGKPILHGTRVFINSVELGNHAGIPSESIRKVLQGYKAWPGRSDNPLWYVRPFEYAIKEGYVFRYLN